MLRNAYLCETAFGFDLEKLLPEVHMLQVPNFKTIHISCSFEIGQAGCFFRTGAMFACDILKCSQLLTNLVHFLKKYSLIICQF